MDPQPEQHETTTAGPSSRSKLGAAGALVLATLGLASSRSSLLRWNVDDDEGVLGLGYRRHLREVTDLGVNGCTMTHAALSPTPLTPTWQASYPGSGADMTLTLTEALTGINTNTIYDPHGRGFDRISTVKTHFPFNHIKGFKQLEKDWPFEKSVVIIRHPKDAIPSLFNLHYEKTNNLPSHSTRAPQEEWIKYRDDPDPNNCNVECQVKKFEDFWDYWMTKYEDRSRLLVVSYERLTSQETGLATAAKLASFLGPGPGVDIPCVWETVVNYKAHVGEGTKFKVSSQREGPKTRPYTENNMWEILAMLIRLNVKYRHDEEFGGILDMYVETTLNDFVAQDIRFAPQIKAMYYQRRFGG